MKHNIRSMQISIPLALMTAVFFSSFAPSPDAWAQGVPGIDANKCLAGKNRCVSKMLSGLLKCRENCQSNPNRCGDTQAECEAKVIAKFDGGDDPSKGCFAKIEAKENLDRPPTVCTNVGDAGDLGVLVNDAVSNLLMALETPVPQFCGGFIGLPCRAGFVCADNPDDDCHPLAGGADCGGVCAADYVSNICSYGDDFFLVGESFKVDCNTCQCIEGGIEVCTKKICFP